MHLPEQFCRTITDLFKQRGEHWLEALPDLIARLEQEWGFRAERHVRNLSYNYVAPVTLSDGTPAMLKLGVPDGAFTDEIDALRLYNGNGICRLLRSDAEQGAMLIERFLPGSTLTELSDDEAATRIAAEVMQQLWIPAPEVHNFATVVEWARGFERLRDEFAGGTGPFPAAMVAKAERLFADLLASAGPNLLLHGDLHHDNILSAERSAWLAIDPKGLVGEAAYEVGALLRNPGDRVASNPDPQRFMARRVAILAETLHIDPQRIAAWGYAQAVLSAWWAYEDHRGSYDHATIQYAEWLEGLIP
ncbi:MAG: aminoglycoside phosphotransferase family protein [Roseiflexaceae bacterium]